MDEVIKKIIGIFWAWACLWVVLDRETRVFLVADSFIRAVVQRDVGFLQISVFQAVLVNGIAVVLGSDGDFICP